MPFNIALSGLNAATTDLEVTGNNIANAATNGFKESRAEFGDLFSNAIQDTSNNSPGQGVRVAKVAQQFSQGSVEFTSRNLDLAISGQGFFVLEDTDGTTSYTRAGTYSVDREGYVVNNSAERLQAYPAVDGVDGTTTYNTGVLEDLRLPTTPSAPQATTEITASLNLDATKTAPTAAFDPADPASYNSSTSTTVYDSLGNPHTATMYFRKDAAADNTWNGFLYVRGVNVTQGGAASFPMEFSSSGVLTNPAAGTPITMDAFTPVGGGEDVTLEMNFDGTTQYGANFGVNKLAQNGFTSGRLAGVDIDSDGVVFARYTNGRSDALAKVALAKFSNEQGLRKIGDSNWAESFDSGPEQLGSANETSFGSIQSGALESSNVNVAEQLVNLITAQRNFQANAQVISTGDQITQAIINIR